MSTGLISDKKQIKYKFMNYLRHNHLDKAKIFYEKYKNEIDIYEHINYFFPMCCRLGCLEVAQWLYNFMKNYTVDEYYYTSAFQQACLNGRLNVVTWLLTLDVTDDMIEKVKDQHKYRLKLVNRFTSSGVSELLYNYQHKLTNKNSEGENNDDITSLII